jgi:hypothetical protein
MTRKYNEIIDEITGKKVFWYEENGVRYSFPEDPANSDYQAYLNPKAEQSTPIVIDEASTL